MALGDGIRRNIAAVDPTERTLLRDALIALNQRFFPGNRTDAIPGGVSWWFKQDEIHQATHVHGGPEFLPWHREIVNRLEGMLRQINPQLSLHYWDWTQDPRAIPNANLGGGATGDVGTCSRRTSWGMEGRVPLQSANPGFAQATMFRARIRIEMRRAIQRIHPTRSFDSSLVLRHPLVATMLL